MLYVASFLVTHGYLALRWVAVVLALIAYVVLKPGLPFRRSMRWLLYITIGASLALAFLTTYLQYHLWSLSELTQNLLPPVQSWSYFAAYVGLRFWLPIGLGLLLAGLWYGFTWLIGTRSERYFDIGEIELTTLLVFAAGWPDVLVLLPVAAVLLVFVSLVRMLLWREQLTTFGMPFLAATIATLLLARELKVLFS